MTTSHRLKIVTSIIVFLVIANTSTALIDTASDFTDPSWINEIEISGTGINSTVNITNNALFFYDGNTSLTQIANLYTTHQISNITVDLDFYPLQTNDYFFIQLDGNDVILRFKNSGNIEYLNTTTVYVPIVAYNNTKYQHLQINFNATSKNTSIVYNGTKYYITNYQNSASVTKLVVATGSTNVPKLYVNNITIRDNSLPELPSTLRKFPYPYKAAWTISSDADTTNTTEFYTMLDYLNTNDEIYENDVYVGKGVGLNVSFSFWMSVIPSSSGIGYYNDYTDTTYDYSLNMLEYMKSGHLDTLHGYSGSSGTSLSQATWLDNVITFLKTNNVNFTSWTNHGDSSFASNMGTSLSWMAGDDIDNTTWYHANRTNYYGNYSIRYIWESTDTTNGLTVNNSFLSSLLYPNTLNDSQIILREIRNRISNSCCTPTLDNLSLQLNENDLNRTIRRNSYVSLYTHLGYTMGSLDTPIPIFNDNVKTAFGRLKNHSIGNGGYDKDLYITSHAKLLKYNEVSLYLNYAYDPGSNTFTITNINSPLGAWVPTVSDLQGITFYTNNPATASVFIGATDVTSSMIQNNVDETGQTSISFHITGLVYPFKPNRIYYGEMTNNVSTDRITYDVRPLGANLTNMTIIPSSGYVNVIILTWNKDGDYYKKQNESSTEPNGTTHHIVGDFPVDTNISVLKNGAFWNKYQSNATGYIDFTYSEGYSSTVQFEFGLYTDLNITSWGNDNTSNADTTIFVSKNTNVTFNATANQTVTTWTWIGANQINGSGSTNSFAWMNFTTVGLYSVSVRGTNDNGTSNTVTWTISVSGASNLTLSGYVNNTFGVNLENARVDFNGTYDLTDATGYYEFTGIDEENYTIIARAIGYWNSSRTQVIGDNTTINFTMRERIVGVASTPGFEALLMIPIVLLLWLFGRQRRF